MVRRKISKRDCPIRKKGKLWYIDGTTITPDVPEIGDYIERKEAVETQERLIEFFNSNPKLIDCEISDDIVTGSFKKGLPGMAKKKVTKKTTKKKAATNEQAGEAGYNYGKTTKLRVMAFWQHLLVNNFKKKLSDSQLEREFKKEFPKREKVQKVQLVRSWFNTGRYGLGYGDMVKAGSAKQPRSIAYEKGQPAGEKRGRPAVAKKKTAPKKKRTAKKKIVKRKARA